MKKLFIAAAILSIGTPAAASNPVSATKGGWRSFTADWGCAVTPAVGVVTGYGWAIQCFGWRVG